MWEIYQQKLIMTLCFYLANLFIHSYTPNHVRIDLPTDEFRSILRMLAQSIGYYWLYMKQMLPWNQ